MKIAGQTREVREFVRNARIGSMSVGFVPTMGALHAGHADLIKHAKASNDVVVVSIFVNPLQFNDPADLAKYPRTDQTDEDVCRQLEVDLIYRPAIDDMYPAGFETRVEPGSLALPFEGRHRPGHFSGMATVVLKLLNIVGADDAYFGEKDFQQLAIVKRMVIDFNHPTRVHGVETVREDDGLAMSSRNINLSRDGRRSARYLNAALTEVRHQLSLGATLSDAVDTGRASLENDPTIEVEYFAAADATDLSHPTENGSIVILVAARIDGVRLIDNAIIPARNT